MKKIIIAGAIVLGAVVIGAATSGHHTSSTTAPPTTPGISKGLGSQDASADIKLGAKWTDNGYGMITGTFTVTNHSSKRSTYFIDLALVSADGKTQYSTDLGTASNIEPGQTAVEKILMTPSEKVPASAVIKITGVQRTASL